MLYVLELPDGGRGAANVVHGYQHIFRGTSDYLEAVLPLWSASEERVFLSNQKVGCYQRMTYVDRADGAYGVRDRREGTCDASTSSPTRDPAVTEYVIHGQCTLIPYKSARKLF